jgi:hypothetical protein
MNDNAMPGTPGIGMLRAIVWKELHERLKVTFVCLVIVVAGQFISLGFQRMMSLAGAGTVGSPFTFTFFTLTSALSGLLIGRAQIVHENRGDRWGFLAHRPVRRSTLFFGKALAGVLLYCVATGVPLAFITAWMAAPGHRPLPWDPSMALPGVADMLCGLVYYFAAMLVGMREARWYGSRFLSLGAAIACSGAVLYVSHFWQALAIAAIGVAVVGMAAVATLIGGGRYEPLSRPGRMALGLTVVPGLTLAGTLVIGIISLTMFSRGAARDGIRSTGYAIAGDGSIVQRVQVQRLFSASQQVVAVKDLQGHAIERYQDSVARAKLTAGVISTPAVSLHPEAPTTLESFGSGYRGTHDLFVQLTSSPPAPSEVSWYFVRRVGLIAAYENRSARLLGWMGPDGFSMGDSLPSHRFEGPLRPSTEVFYAQPVLAFPSAVYRVDLRQRVIRKVFAPTPGDTVLGAVTSGDSTLAMSVYGPRAKFDVIATIRSVYVQAADGTAELSEVRDSVTAAYGTVTVSRALLASGTPTFFWYSASDRPFIHGEPGTAAGHITEFGEGNRIVAQVPIPRDTVPTATDKVSAEDVLSASAIPVTWRVARKVYLRLSGRRTVSPRIWQRSEVVDWIVSSIASLIGAALAFLLAQLFAFERNRRLLWTALGFALGPLGVLLMLSLIDWPIREICPACARKRVVTRVRCERCDAPFLPPALDGTEIF